MGGTPENTFHVLPAQANHTLAAALRHWLSGHSWAQVRKLVAARRVTVSGNVCLDPARRLKIGEPVKVLGQAADALPKQEDVQIVYLDAHVVVVDKPAGM